MSQSPSFQLRRVRPGSQPAASLPGLDMHLFLPTLLLVTFGMVMVFSASYPMVLESRHGDAYYFVKRQAAFAVLGLLALWVSSRLRLRLLRAIAYPLLGLSLALLGVVLFIGREVHGARSWLSFGAVSFQPSELAKVALLLALARLLADHPGCVSSLKGLLPALALAGAVGGLVLLGKDFGTAAVAGLAVFVLLFLAGVRMKHLIGLGTMAAAMAAVFIAMEPYRMKRILAFFHPDALAESGGYHITRSLIALGSGGPLGLGFSRSREKFFYLPTPHTDSIFAVIGEELGLVFCLGVLALFFWLGWRGLKISAAARETFPALAAAAMTNLLLLQAATNLLVIVGLLPPTGLPLPFLSYGGSSLFFSLVAVGIIANVSRHSALGAQAAAEENPGVAASQHRSRARERRYSLRPRGL